jgi:hypothetical membrane protein
MMDGPSLKRAGAALVVGVGQFILFLTLAEVLYPGYSVSTNTISDLGATCSRGICRFVQPSSDIFEASVIVLGAALIFTAYYVWKGAGPRSLSAFEMLAGVGAIGVGVFNESYGSIHFFFSAFVFVSAAIQAILQSRVAKPPFSYFSMVTGVITLVAIVLYGGHAYLGLGQGGMERMIAYPVLISGIAFGGYMLAKSQEPALVPRSPPRP